MILARWLMGITLAIAEKHPDDEHAQCHGYMFVEDLCELILPLALLMNMCVQIIFAYPNVKGCELQCLSTL